MGIQSGRCDLRSDKVLNVPVAGSENLPTIEDDDDEEEAERCPRRVWLEAASERKLPTVDSLCFHSLLELDVGNEDGNPGKQTGNRGECLEPAKNHGRVTRDCHVSETGKRRRKQNRPNRNTALCALEEDAGSLAILSKRK